MKTKLKSWLVILVVFLAGFGAGVVVTRGAVRQFVQQAVSDPDRVREWMERRLTRQLDLDAAQQEKVRVILTGSQSELRAVREDFRPRFLAIVTNAEERVSAVLTEEQRVRYEQVRAESRRLWEPRTNP